MQSNSIDYSWVLNVIISCGICLSEYLEDEDIRYLPCKHHFHSECVDQWLKISKSCPFCKRLIDKTEENEEKEAISEQL